MSISPQRLEERRRQLVDAAHALIRETGDAGFTMAQLAARAGVSPATPYNLLGSKTELLRLVVHDVFESFAVRLDALPRTGPLRRLLAAVDAVTAFYTEDPAFLAGLYRTAHGADRAEIGTRMFSEGRALWSGMVRAALHAGELEPFVRVELLTDVLLRMMSVTTETWLALGWDADRFGQEMAHAARLVLAPVATPSQRDGLLQEVRALHGVMAPPLERSA